MNIITNRPILASALSLLLIVPATATIVIDDFSTGDNSQSLTSGQSYYFQNGSMLGGNRVEVGGITSGLGSNLTLDVSSGVFTAKKGATTTGFAQVAYGYVPGSPVTFSDLNADFSAESKFCVTVNSNDTTGLLSVYTISNNVVWGVSTPIGVITNPTDVFFDFSSYTGINFSDIDQIIVDVSTGVGGSASLDVVMAVPEPATLFILGTGGLAMVSRRRPRV